MDASIGEIKFRIREAIHKHLLEEGLTIELEKVSAPIICTAKDRRVVGMARNDLIFTQLEKGLTLVALQRELLEDQHEYLPVELVIMQSKTSYFMFKEQKPLTMSRFMLINKDLTNL